MTTIVTLKRGDDLKFCCPRCRTWLRPEYRDGYLVVTCDCGWALAQKSGYYAIDADKQPEAPDGAL